MKKIKNSKVLFIYKIIKTIVTIFLIAALAVVLAQKVTKNNFAMGGIRVFTIISESMAPDYKIGDILISKEVNASELEIGHRVTYMAKKGDLAGLVITHEIIDKEERDGKIMFITKGTANDYADPEISEDDVYGKVVYKTVFFSLLSRWMNNMVVYYSVFVIVGVSASYQLITSFMKREEEEENE